MFITTDSAVEGMPHRPAIAKVRLVFATSAGPPHGPAGFRVSTTRHGVSE
jgi:hypothetical protein